jgi:hypothetical protein
MNTIVVVTGIWCAAALLVGVAVGGWLGACRRTLDASDDWVLWEGEMAGTGPTAPTGSPAR